tara:strand:+ start:1261 stop:1437 length:177 start_codon:yes stop_codon:yes gene_type:complete
MKEAAGRVSTKNVLRGLRMGIVAGFSARYINWKECKTFTEGRVSTKDVLLGLRVGIVA